jgi:Ca2+-binding EF-hand superfamily protein
LQNNQRYYDPGISNFNDTSATSSKSQISSTNSRSSKKVIITEKISGPTKAKVLFDNSSQTSFDSDSDLNENNEEEEEENDFDKSVQQINELTEDDLEFLLDNTSFKPEQIQKWHSDFLTKCPSGYISYNQFKSSYKLLLPLDLNDKSKQELIAKLFSLFDIDGDGSLNFSEFLISFWIRCKAPIREKFTWIFNMFDSDRNGYLNYVELRNALNMCLNVDDLDELLEQLNNENLMRLSSIKSKFNSNINSNNNNDLVNSVNSSLSSSSSMDNKNNYCDHYSASNNIKKYDLFSKTAKLIEDKLNQTIYLLDMTIKNNSMNNLNNTEIYSKLNTSSSSSSSSSSFNINSDSNYEIIDSCLVYREDSMTNLNFETEIKKIQIKREEFLDLCEKYKTFRKLILPIRNFYE